MLLWYRLCEALWFGLVPVLVVLGRAVVVGLVLVLVVLGRVLEGYGGICAICAAGCGCGCVCGAS